MRCLSMRLVSRFTPQQKAGCEEVKSETTSTTTAPWIRVLGWTSVATGALAVGYFVGRNLRDRYRVSRAPYDFYSHAGDKRNGIEYGVGI